MTRTFSISARPAPWAMVALLLITLPAARAQEPPPNIPVILWLDFDGTVNPGTAEYVIDGIAEGEREGVQAVIIRLDTPGGLLTSTRDIVQAMLGAKVPVVVYVSPGGAHAGSAGAFITMASHVAAMAPGTNIGAAHPVSLGGEGEGEDKASTMDEKAVNDAAAFMVSLAERRGRNKEWAERAVRESLSASAMEALNIGVIDIVAEGRSELMVALNGWSVEVEGGRRTIQTREAEILPFAMTLRQRLINVIGDPNVAYLLLILGMAGLLLEIYHPGAIFPGVIGGICLVLAAVALTILPVALGGILLIALAIVFFVAEAFVPSFGALGIGGAVALFLGSMILIQPDKEGYYFNQDFGVSWTTALPVALIFLAFFLYVGSRVMRSQRDRVVTGMEGMIGEVGQAMTDLQPQGRVFMHGEIWRAHCAQGAVQGERVRVEEVRGLVLLVAPVEGEDLIE